MIDSYERGCCPVQRFYDPLAERAAGPVSRRADRRGHLDGLTILIRLVGSQHLKAGIGGFSA